MPNTTITDLPSAGSADPNAVVAADNAAGTLTEKVTLQQIADLVTTSTLLPAGTQGDVLTYDSYTGWGAAAPSGGNPFDQSLNTTDAVSFTSVTLPNTSSLSEGSFDNGFNGNYGISLNCAAFFELNWQAGHLMCTNDGGATSLPILCDSAIEFPGAGIANMQIDNAGITFPDGTTQTTAGGGIPAPNSPNGGDILSYDSGSSAWIASAPTGIPAPGSPNNNDILSWNGSAWVAVSPSTPSLPSASQYDVLVYDSTNWVSQPLWGGAYSPFPSGASDRDVLKWDSTSSDWYSAPAIPDYAANAGYSVGDLVAYSNTIWRATASGMGNTPQYGSAYWTNLSVIDAAELPTASSTGDVVTWNGSSWIAQQPAAGATYLSGVVATDIFADGLLEEVLTLGPIVGNSTYLVEGLVVYRTMYNQQMRLHLSAFDEDGEVWLDHDRVTADFGNARLTGRRLDQFASETVEFDSSGDAVVDVPIRFRALIQTANIASTSLVLLCGDGSDGNPCDILAGSWMVATKIA